MAQHKRVKPTGKVSRQHAAAKQAVKKKSKGAAKFHNEQLRATLDNQASTVYKVNQVSPSVVKFPSGGSQEDVLSLTSSLGRL